MQSSFESVDCSYIYTGDGLVSHAGTYIIQYTWYCERMLEIEPMCTLICIVIFIFMQRLMIFAIAYMYIKKI